MQMKANPRTPTHRRTVSAPGDFPRLSTSFHILPHLFFKFSSLKHLRPCLKSVFILSPVVTLIPVVEHRFWKFRFFVLSSKLLFCLALGTSPEQRTFAAITEVETGFLHPP